MPDFGEKDWAVPTLLSKDGEPSFRMECHTLQEAFVRVERWPTADQARARFWVTGKDKGYSFRFLNRRSKKGSPGKITERPSRHPVSRRNPARLITREWRVVTVR